MTKPVAPPFPWLALLMPGPRKMRQNSGRKQKGVSVQVRTLRTRITRADMSALCTSSGVHQIELEIQNEALRESQLALQESRDRYADLYDFAPVGYLTLTKKGLISEGNLTSATILGIERQNLIKKPFSKFVTKGDLDRWYRHILQVLATTDKQVCELKLRKNDDSIIEARLESIRMGKPPGDFVIRTAVSDMTDLATAEENLALKSQDLDELSTAYRAITDVQDKLRENVKELTLRENQLKDALAEKEVLLAEIHHRVKNNLTAFISLLELDGSFNETPSGQVLKKNLQNRARSMALVHNTLYQTKKYSDVDMQVYLSTLVGEVVGSYGGVLSLEVHVTAEGISLDIGRAMPIGLIINELVTNSLKYAFPEGRSSHGLDENAPCTILVSLSKDAGKFILRVSDNGVGLPPGIDIGKTRSLGLRLVNFLAMHQVRAKVEVNTEKGTEFIFRFEE